MSKKLLFVLSALLIAVFVLSACAPKTPVVTEVPVATDAHDASSLPDLGGREVIVAVENAYPPFNFIDKTTNQGAGWDFDAWKEICALLNFTPVMTEAAWDGIFEAAAVGQYDVVADGVTITEERKLKVAFSDPYLTYGQVILARADESRFTDAQTLAALTETKVASQLGTTNEAKAIEIVGEARVSSFDTFDSSILALLSQDVDAVIIDQPAALGFMAANQGKLKIVGEPLTSEALGFVFKQGSDLIAPVNAALAELKANGKLDELYQRWFVNYVP
jgi:polar amino acid transport system substrate-binding protein